MKMVFEMVEWSVLKCYLNLLVLEHHDYVLRIEYWGETTFIVDMFHRVNKEYDWFSTITNSDNECDGLRDAMVWATEQVVSSTNEWYAPVLPKSVSSRTFERPNRGRYINTLSVV